MTIVYQPYLAHYNPYHDNLGRFAKAAFGRTIKKGKDKGKVSPAEEITKGASDATNEFVKATTNIMDTTHMLKNRKYNSQNRAKEMSDKELRDAINRLNMEKQYNNLTAKETSSGMETAKSILSTLGSIAAITASTAGAVASIMYLKEKANPYSIDW